MQDREISVPSTRRRLAWLSVGALAAMLMLGSATGAVLAATSLHQSTPIAWNASGFADDCDDANLAPGQVLWHFVLVQTNDPLGGSTLTANFSAGGQQIVNAYKKSGKVLHFNVITGQVSLTSASTNRNGRHLNLSHICAGEETTSTTTNTETSNSETSNSETSNE
jgi:hypothetical protein